VFFILQVWVKMCIIPILALQPSTVQYNFFPRSGIPVRIFGWSWGKSKPRSTHKVNLVRRDAKIEKFYSKTKFKNQNNIPCKGLQWLIDWHTQKTYLQILWDYPFERLRIFIVKIKWDLILWLKTHVKLKHSLACISCTIISTINNTISPKL
jgi:hypothetical protein